MFDSARSTIGARTHARRGVLLARRARGGHGDWAVKAALNQGDLSSWILAGNYVTREPGAHRYQFGMSYGAHRYEGGNAAALAAMPERSAKRRRRLRLRRVESSERLTIGYGANYAHYDYLAEPRTSARASASTYQHPRIGRAFVRSRRGTLPLPGPRNSCRRRARRPAAAADLCAADARRLSCPRTCVTTRWPSSSCSIGATLGVRAFYQAIDEQLVTVFGLRRPHSRQCRSRSLLSWQRRRCGRRRRGDHLHPCALRPTCAARSITRLAAADWANDPSRDRIRLARNVPGALRDDGEQIHDVTTTLETEFPESATRVFLLYKINQRLLRETDLERPGLDARWDVQVSQGLPFMRFTNAEWEMLVGVRNLFREAFTETSVYDELLVSRPPKRSSAASPSSSDLRRRFASSGDRVSGSQRRILRYRYSDRVAHMQFGS